MPERIDPAPWGAFPVRFPIGRWLGIVASVLLLPVWWQINRSGLTELQKYYLADYVKTSVQTGHFIPASFYGAPPFFIRPPASVKPYLLYVMGVEEQLSLATDQDLVDTPADVHVKWLEVSPKWLKNWLQTRVYPGGIADCFHWLVILTTVWSGGLIVAGVRWDYHRRRRAQSGVHLGGSRWVSIDRFNKAANTKTWWSRWFTGSGS
jgi:hypothetical protein